MTTITIPKTLLKEQELVLIPRKEYEELLCISVKKNLRKEKYTQLDKDLDAAIGQYKTRKSYGPFKTAKEGKVFFESRFKKSLK